MYGTYAETAQHRIGAQIEKLAEQCSLSRDSCRMATIQLPDNRECEVKVYLPRAARKPDPEAP